MAYTATLQYVCPTCGHTWEDTFQFEPAVSGSCQCPNCEESVTPQLVN